MSRVGRNMFHLLVRQPGRAETPLPMRGDQLTIGRSVGCQLSFPQEKALSRTHAVFAREGGGWTIEDLGSSNGTHLNGTRLRGRRPLEIGDRIRLGSLDLLFEAGMPASELVGAEFESGPVAQTIIQYTDLQAILARSQALPASFGRPQELNPLSDAVTALLKVGRELGAHQPLAQLFETILELATDAVGARRGLLMTLDGEQLVIRASRGETFRISKGISEKVQGKRLR
jgi:hypothetical protein